jgi:hypothetical protein
MKPVDAPDKSNDVHPNGLHGATLTAEKERPESP